MFRNILLASFTCLFLTLAASAQDRTVTQGFVDDANAAFRELKATRDANTQLVEANQALKDSTSFLWGIIKKKRCK
jgi:hypothetical protein